LKRSPERDLTAALLIAVRFNSEKDQYERKNNAGKSNPNAVFSKFLEADYFHNRGNNQH
jgi:hypothetical protein